MAEPLEKLVVMLDLDATAFKKGMEEIKAELQGLVGSLRELQTAGAQVGQAMSQIKKGLTLQDPAKALAASAVAAAALQKKTDALSASMGKSTAAKKEAAAASRKLAEEQKKTSASFDMTKFGKMLGAGALIAGLAMRIFNEMKSLMKSLNAAVGLPAIIDWVKDLGGELNKLYRTASGMGKKVVPAELWVWGKTAERFGSSSDAFITSLRNVQAQIGKLQLSGSAEGALFRGAKTVRALFQAMQLPEEKLKGKDALTVLEALSTHIGKLNYQQRATVGKFLGIDKGTMEILQQGREFLPEILAYYRKLAPDQPTITKLARAADGFKQLEHNIEAAKMALVAELAPAITEVLHLLEGVTAWVRENPDEARNMFYALAIAVTGLTVALSIFTIVAGLLLAVVLIPISATLFQIIKLMRALGDETTSVGEKIKAAFEGTSLGSVIKYFRVKRELRETEKDEDILTAQAVATSQASYRATVARMMQKQGAPAGAVAPPSSTSVTIGEVSVHTRATDAQGIAKGLPAALGGALTPWGLQPYQLQTGVR